MNKEEVSQRVLLKGEPLAINKFTWDEETNTFSSRVDGLIIDFKGINYCTFSTGSHCTFETGIYCIFNTGYSCIFKTRSDCTFDTGNGCIFDTESDCTFSTGSSCIFKTGIYCTFKTGYSCTFNTGYSCTFDTEYSCTFKTGKECIVVRRDIFEVIKLKKDVEIRLNKCKEKGYTIINPKRVIVFDGKEIELSEDSYQEFIKQFKN